LLRGLHRTAFHHEGRRGFWIIFIARRDRTNLLDALHEDVDQFRIELRPSIRLHLGQHALLWPRLLVLPLRRQRIEHIRHRHDSREQRDRLARHARPLPIPRRGAALLVVTHRDIAWIAPAIPAFMMVEHDIDRVFALADAVTVMNEGRVLIHGSAQDARDSAEVQAVYIGSGSHALAAVARTSAAREVPLLRLERVNTFYGKSHILRDVSLEVREGEILALLGRNGAGKSTLLKTLVGITPPATGDIVLGDKALTGLSSAQITRMGLSYVPQGRGLFAGMTVAENMELGRLRRRNAAGIFWDEERIFSFFPRIRERWHSPADYLSGGEQQMVAVARALSGDTRLLLLDEPFEGLAPAVVEELFEAFDRLRHEVSIMIVDHHLDLALALSDRAVVLERGAVSHTGSARELSTDLALRRKVLWL